MKLVLMLLLPLTVFSEDKVRRVKVFGECNKRLETDRGSIVVTVTNTEKDIKKSTWKTTNTYNKFKSSIMALDLKDKEVETVNYNVFEKKEWTRKKYVSLGYTAEMGLKISTSEISRIGDIIKLANKFEIKKIGSLNTFVSKALQKKEYTNCLSTASKDALEKAKRLASVLSAKVGKVLTINETRTIDRPPIRHRRMEMAMAKSAVAPDVTPSKIDFTVRVDIEFQLQ